MLSAAVMLQLHTVGSSSILVYLSLARSLSPSFSHHLQQVVERVESGELAPAEAGKALRPVPPTLRCCGSMEALRKHAAHLARELGLARCHQDVGNHMTNPSLD